MRKVLIAVALLITAAFIGVGGFVFIYSDFTSSAVQEASKEDAQIIDRLLDPKRRFLDRTAVGEMKKAGVKFVTIPKGYNFRRAADRLEEEGILSSALLFRAFAWLERGKIERRGLKAGDFAFHPAMTPPQVFDALFSEPVVYVEKVTIPEGFNLREIAQRLDAQGVCKKDEFLRAAYDPKLLKKLGVPGDRMEGYLFPDTYEFKVGEKADVVVTRMYQKFRQEWLPLWEQRAREMGLDRHKAVTLASIIEKETGQKGERGLVSSVFHNRRRLTMPLQTDPTTCYAIMEVEGWPDKKCNITSSNKLIRNPYNTYYVRDFPPGPIASPGRLSLRAAVFPEQSKYLFFVSKNDGTHVFSEKYSVHSSLVKTWQQDYFRNRGQKVNVPTPQPRDHVAAGQRLPGEGSGAVRRRRTARRPARPQGVRPRPRRERSDEPEESTGDF
jgi:UPF0755 protein